MSIIIDKETRVIVQGITGREGTFHAQQMLQYGTKVVGGVTPGKKGENVEGLPVFDFVSEAVEATDANATMILVPAPFAPDAIYEAMEAGIQTIVCITEGLPVLAMSQVYPRVRASKSRLIGPNTMGVISPGKCKIGIMPGHIHEPGNVGIASRSGTLTYEIVQNLSRRGIGQSSAVGIGGDPIVGSGFIDILELYKEDPETDAVIIVGEIGGTDEEIAADWVQANMKKPVFGYIAGRAAPEGKRMGHAGAIISGGKGTAKDKIEAFEAHGIQVGANPEELAEKVKSTIG